MALEKFKLESLLTLDKGRIAEAIQEEFSRIERDMRDRPHVDAARSVAITIAMKPVQSADDGELESAVVTVRVHGKMPRRDSNAFTMQADEKGGLVYNELSPKVPNQRTIDEPATKVAKKG